tara:strand:- start:160 stop:741 length:582 start_codon:yes stop_codon:yes gene_type:complete
MKTYNVDLRIEIEDTLFELFIKHEGSEHMEFEEFEEYCIKNKKWSTDIDRFKAHSKIWGPQTFVTGKTEDDAYSKLLDYLSKTENKLEDAINRFGLYKDRDQKFIHFPKTEENLSVVVEITYNDRWKGSRVVFNKRFPTKVQLHCRLCSDDGDESNTIYKVFYTSEDFSKYIYYKKRGYEEGSEKLIKLGYDV